MKQVIKFILLGILGTSILLHTVGCSQNKIAKVEDRTDSNEITLKIVWWGSEERNDLTMRAIALFEEKNPGIKMETQSVSATGDLRINLAMQIADQDMPDIIQMNYDFMNDYSQRGLLEPLNPYIEKGILNLTDIEESYLESGMNDNKLYGIPLGINAYTLAVNVSLFEKAGINIPSESYTFDELYQIATKLKAEINEEGFYPLANFFDFNSFVRSTGSTYYNQDGTALGYEDDNVYAEYFKVQRKWLEEGLIAPSSVTKGRKDQTALIVQGESALFPMQSNGVARLSQYARQVFKMISTPASEPGKEGSFVKPSMFFSVSAYSDHKEAAALFIDFITNDIEVNNILMGERGVPISSQVSDAIKEQLGEAEKQQYEYMDYLKLNPSPIDPPSPQFIGGVNSLFSRLSSQVMGNNLLPEEAAKQFRTDADKILRGIKGE